MSAVFLLSAPFAAAVSGTTTSLTASPNPLTTSQAAYLLATVAGSNPTGTVTFKDGAAIIGTRALDSNGAAFWLPSWGVAGTHSLTVVYGGDSNNAPSASAAISVIVDLSPSVTTLTANLNPSTFGQSVTLLARVSAQTSYGGVVTFRDGNTVLGTGTVTPNLYVVLTTSALTAGMHIISAAYEGNSATTASTSQSLSLVVNKVASATALAVSAIPATAGQPVTLTATVTGSSPSGLVTFKDGATTLGSGTLSGGVAALVTSFAVAGAHGVTVEYGGDSSNLASTSAVTNETVNVASTSTTLTSSPNPASVNQTTLLTAAVVGSSPSGTVTFKDGTLTLGTGTVSGGVATLSTTFAVAGSHDLTAVYGGDANNLASSSAVMNETVSPTSSVSVLAVSANPVTAGQSVTLTATVTGSDPGGAVTFKDGTSTLGVGTLSGGVANLGTSFATAGLHGLTVVYVGDSNNSGSTSSAITLTVNVAISSTSTNLSLSMNPATQGQSVVFTAAVTGSAPTGTITFKDGTATLGSSALSAGAASLSSAALTVGAHDMTSVYSGDPGNAGSTSAIATLIINSGSGPTVSIKSPTSNQRVTDKRAPISGVFSPLSLALDLSRTQLLVDGVDFTVNATIIATGIYFVPVVDWVAGNHDVRLTVFDTAGNSTTAIGSFVFDPAPQIYGETPSNVFVVSTSPGINVFIQDTGTGVQLSSIKLFLDGADVTSLATISASKVSYQATALSVGVHAVSLRASSNSGQLTSKDWKFTVLAPPPGATTDDGVRSPRSVVPAVRVLP
jgi:hypothetical protein